MNLNSHINSLNDCTCLGALQEFQTANHIPQVEARFIHVIDQVVQELDLCLTLCLDLQSTGNHRIEESITFTYSLESRLHILTEVRANRMPHGLACVVQDVDLVRGLNTKLYQTGTTTHVI